VTRSAGIYERELRELLRGEPAALRKYSKRLPPVDRATADAYAQRPFLVVRAAGSLGFDLVALRPEFAFPLEVKSSTEATIRFSAASGRAHAQLVAHQATVAKVGLLVVYAFRRVGGEDEDTWRLFATGGGNSDGARLKLLRDFLPPVATTPEGHGVLRWSEGRPLLEFLRRVSFLTDRSPVVPAP
jgi:hypothetical protein